MNAKLQHGKNLTRPANRGVSLIEVLVAIAILAIGMLAVLLLFPAGLIAIGTAANSTMADRLGQAELEKITGSNVQSVAAVYSNDDFTANENPQVFLTSANNQISSTTTPGTSGYGANPSSALAMNVGTDVNAFRSIKGETIRVPAPNAQGLSLYTVVADPIESGTMQVNGLPWQGIAGNSDSTASDYLDVGSATAAGQPQYLIDYTAGKICLAPEANGSTPYAQNIVFTIIDATGQTIIQHLTVAATPTMQSGVWVKLSDLVTTNTDGTPSATPGQEGQLPWSSGSDILVRNFTMFTPPSNNTSTGLTWASSDPFQYQMYTPDYVAASPSATTPSANLGVIAFNPVASTMHSANGLPLEAVLNYRAYDWHIISEDRLVTSATSTARLSLVNLLSKTASDKLSDNSTNFTGLFTYAGTTTPADPDFIVLDMDTGKVLVPGTDYTVNYPDGSVSFINNTNAEYVNDHMRIFYHPSADWAVALARAPIVYRLDPTVGNLSPALSSYSVTGTTINFPLVDIGKQVDIRFTYTNGGTPQTAEDLYTIVSITGTTAGVNLASAALDTTIPALATNVTPTAVKGVSLSAIVIWKENNIWHNRTLTTVLTAPSQMSQTNLQ